MLKIYALKAYDPKVKGLIRDHRVVWALEEMGLGYERVSMNPTKEENRTPAYLKMNPFGKVPTLQDGDFSIFESGAICQYLAEKHGRLIAATGTPEYFECIQWCYVAVSSIEPQTQRLLSSEQFMDKGPAADVVHKMASDVSARYFSYFNELFAKQDTILASGFTIADILLATNFHMIRESAVLSNYPNVKKYYQNMAARPAFKKAMDMNGE